MRHFAKSLVPQSGKDLIEQRPLALYRFVGGWKTSPYQAWAKGSWIRLKRKQPYNTTHIATRAGPGVRWQWSAFGKKNYTNGQWHRIEGFPQSDKTGNKPSEVGSGLIKFSSLAWHAARGQYLNRTIQHWQISSTKWSFVKQIINDARLKINVIRGQHGSLLSQGLCRLAASVKRFSVSHRK